MKCFQEGKRIDVERLGDFEKLDDIKPSFAALNLGHK
jgi:hypothetical protein